jgi:hypothetical protein
VFSSIRFSGAIVLRKILAGVTTTGTSSRHPRYHHRHQGTDFIGLNDMLKQVYTKPFENNVEADSEVADLIARPKGSKSSMGPTVSRSTSATSSRPAAVSARCWKTTTSHADDADHEAVEHHDQAAHRGRRALGSDAAPREEGPGGVRHVGDKALPMKAQRLAFHKDRQYLGTGTGIICRYNGTPDGHDGDPLDNMFGISGLDDRAAMLLLRDDNLRAGPNANGTSLRAGTALVARSTTRTRRSTRLSPASPRRRRRPPTTTTSSSATPT